MCPLFLRRVLPAWNLDPNVSQIVSIGRAVADVPSRRIRDDCAIYKFTRVRTSGFSTIRCTDTVYGRRVLRYPGVYTTCYQVQTLRNLGNRELWPYLSASHKESYCSAIAQGCARARAHRQRKFEVEEDSRAARGNC